MNEFINMHRQAKISSDDHDWYMFVNVELHARDLARMKQGNIFALASDFYCPSTLHPGECFHQQERKMEFIVNYTKVGTSDSPLSN